MRANSFRPTASAPSPRAYYEKPYQLRLDESESRHSIRAGGVADRHVWRQLELARPDLVADQLSAHRGAGKVSPFLRRYRAGGVSYGLGEIHEPQKRLARNRDAAFQAVPPQRGRAASVFRRRREFRERRELAGSTCSFTNTFTAIPAAAWVLRIRRAGRR